MLPRVARVCVLSLLLSIVVLPSAGSAPRECTRADISVRLRLDKLNYESDEPVRMKMIVRNVSGRRCTMRWSDGNFGSLFVRRENGGRVWSDELCVSYTQMVVEENWPRGHRERYRGVWHQHTAGDPDNCKHDGPLAPQGLYSARGLFEGAGEVRSNRRWFRLHR